MFEKNFLEMTPGLTKTEAVLEANRCLYCYDAPCMRACPTSIDVPKFIKKIASNNMKGSAKAILDANPLGASCARVCPTEELCEGACVLNHETKPIQIGALQRYATDWMRETETEIYTPAEKNGYRIAVIGSGPAGLAASRELALLGYDVTIFEAQAKAGGLNQYGIVSFRLPQSIVDWEVEQVMQLGVDIQLNTTVGVDITKEALLEQYDRIILAVGMSSVPMLGIPNETAPNVLDAIEFVKETKTTMPQTVAGKSVVVIGAGNTAIDAATCAKRLGAKEVTIAYRRSEQEMTAYDFEYAFAKQEGIRFKWYVAPSEIVVDERNEVTGILFKETAMENGRLVETGQTEVLEADIVIRAIGQKRLIELFETFELKHEYGRLQMNNATLQTSNPLIYACGDVTYGTGIGDATVVSAAQQGKDSAYAIHNSLSASLEDAV